ncbi:Cof-type HAD-IIB family hydrolase [Pseudobutyrivibrio sp. MD2005]|uniref:Cof-type HAD-IIB family hydrolase n=1 Tax=Pseudobutyrivibrio sp. MD2005 TaxID=1410616 RepID=UPI0004855C24|nr:HAD family hydrolase [Pseudobutyrivibrio sp. MD2005]
MTKKILAVDLDGTLFDDEKDICKANMEALDAMLSAGHILAVDTGRPTHVMKKILHPFGIFERENVYLLGYQGTIGTKASDDEIIFGHYLDNEMALKLLHYSKDAGYSTLAFEYGNIYSFRHDSAIDKYAERSKEKITIINSPEELAGHKLTKVIVLDFDNPDSLFDFQAAHEDELSSEFLSMFSDVCFLEYIGKNTNKGEGLKELAAHLDIPMENTVACGDERNDIFMVKMAGVGVAVANARDELKAEADYITTVDNNNGAVAEAINKFILN